MIILSFAKTTAALVNLEKSVTRREWSDAYAERFKRAVEKAGGLAQAWSASPHRKGRKVGVIRVLSVDKEPTRDIPDGDWEAEGFAFMERNGLNVGKDLTCANLFRQWREDPDRTAYTVRFEVESLTCEECGDQVDVGFEKGWGDQDVLCDECFDEVTFECCLCRETDGNDRQGAIGNLLAVVDDEAGVPVGLYRVAEHPYYMGAVVGGGWLYGNSMERIGDVPKGVETDGYPVAHLCTACSKKLVPLSVEAAMAGVA